MHRWVSIVLCTCLLGCSNNQAFNALLDIENALASQGCDSKDLWASLSSMRPMIVDLNDAHCDSLFNHIVLSGASQDPEPQYTGRIGLGPFDNYLQASSSIGVQFRAIHALRWSGNFNAARAHYARIVNMYDDTDDHADIEANLAMEYNRVGLTRSALVHALRADSLFAAANKHEGRIWTQRLLYDLHRRLGNEDRMLASLSTFRRYHRESRSVLKWQMVDTITEVNLIHSILQSKNALRDMRIAFGAEADSFLSMYRAVLVRYPDSWGRGLLQSNGASVPRPKPIIRRFSASGLILPFTDSLVRNADGDLAQETSYGTFRREGKEWLLTQSQKSLHIQSAKSCTLPVIDTIYRSARPIRAVFPLGSDTLLIVRSDSMIVWAKGHGVARRDCRTLFIRADELDVKRIAFNTFLIVDRNNVTLYQIGDFARLASIPIARHFNHPMYTSGSWNASITKALNNVFLIKHPYSSMQSAVFVDHDRRSMRQLAIKIQPDIIVAYGKSYNFNTDFLTRLTCSLRSDTLMFHSVQATLIPSTSQDVITSRTAKIHAPGAIVAYRDVDVFDVIDTASNRTYPQFAVPVPIEANSQTELGVMCTPDGRLSCYYHDGHVVVTTLLSQEYYSLAPELTIRSHDSEYSFVARDSVSKIRVGKTYSLFASSNLLTGMYDISGSYTQENGIVKNVDRTAFPRVLLYTPMPHDLALRIPFGPKNDTIDFEISTPIDQTSWFQPSLITLFGLAISYIAIILLQKRKELRQAAITAAKEQQLELLREDMHDMIGSRLVRIASLARQASPENNEEVLARIHDMTIVTVRSLRNLLTLMAESSMTDQDFYGSMREYVMESCKDARIECSIDVNVNDTTSLDNAGRHELLMIISEMLTNTIRHASATHVRFSINADPLITTITWSDNGTGIDPSAKRGNGLHNIERRAKRINALVEIDTAQNSGTRYTVSFSNASGTQT